MLQILKVINNNTVQASNDAGQELVVMGKGLGFKAKLGDIVDEQAIEKSFIIQSEDNYIKEMFAEIPLAYLEVAKDIITMAEEQLGGELGSNLLITLADHICLAVRSAKKDERLTNPLAWSVQRLYIKEYQIGMKAVQLIEQRFQVRLSDTEAASVALHIINAKKQTQFISETYQAVAIIEEIYHIVELYFSRKFDHTSLSFARFMTHLQYFAQRIMDHSYPAPLNDSFLYEQVSLNYPDAFKCSEKIKHFVEVSYNYRLVQEEQIYLTIHIQRLIAS